MSTYINFQTETELIEEIIDSKNFESWTSKNLRTRGNKLFLILTGEMPITKYPKEIFITSSITDIDLWFEQVNLNNKIFIQQFEYGDYKGIINYLSNLYE